jgi:ribosomal protein L32
VPLCVQVNVGFGMDAVSKSAVSRMKKRAFRNVDVKKAGSTFSKCSECTELKEFQCAATRNSAEEKKWQCRFDELIFSRFLVIVDSFSRCGIVVYSSFSSSGTSVLAGSYTTAGE